MIFTDPGRDVEVREPLLLGTRRVRRHPHRHLDAARPPRARGRAAAGDRHGARRAHHRDRRGHAAGAAVPAADSRDQERPDAAAARGDRRHVRSAEGRVRRSRDVLQRGQRQALGRPHRAGRAEGEPRDGRRAARGRRGDLQRRRASCCSPIPPCARWRRRTAAASALPQPWRDLVQKTLASRQSHGPVSVPRARGGRRAGQRVAGQHARGRRRRSTGWSA